MFLQGPFDDLTGLMSDDLRSKGYIPVEEPHTALGFRQVQSAGGEFVDPFIFSTTGNDALVDWVFIELRDKGNPANVLATRSALLQRDGDVVDLDGTSAVSFATLPPDDYFVAIKHRNHHGAMCVQTVALSSDVPAILNLSDTTTQTYGTEAQLTKSGKNMLWAGSVTRDGVIKYAGANNDRDPILVRIGGLVPSATVFGYFPEDVNLDGVVKYGGLNNDRDIILLNIGGAVATDTRVEQLP